MTNHILGIGIDKYTSCNSLDNPVKDLTNIVDVLVGKYEFEKSNINLLTDDKATQENIINALEGLLDTQTVTDNLLILFAGHGDYDDKLELGYLLPVESIPYSKSTYIPYSTIFNYIKAIKSHHILLISDSCFSGSVFNFRSSILTAKDKLDRIPSKWAITSGRIEPVADGKPGHNSPFAFSLLKNLKNNSEPEFGVSELTNRIISDVAGSLPQIPRGEPLQLLGHKGGEFIFRMKPNTKTKTVTAKAIDNSDDLNKLIVSYYEAINKREEAENENKAGTIKRIHQEIFSINNLIQKELIRELEDKKSQLLSKGGLESVLPKQFLVEREELLKIKEEKNTIVRKQKYDEAARLRDIEKALIEKILKENAPTFKKLFDEIAINNSSIFNDYFILTTALDFIPINEAIDYKNELEKLFTQLLFIEISKRDKHISEFIYRDDFDNLYQQIRKVLDGIKRSIN
jgi:hypothetical protein